MIVNNSTKIGDFLEKKESEKKKVIKCCKICFDMLQMLYDNRRINDNDDDGDDGDGRHRFLYYSPEKIREIFNFILEIILVGK